MSEIVRMSTCTGGGIFTTFITFDDDTTYTLELRKSDTPLIVADTLQEFSETIKKDNK